MCSALVAPGVDEVDEVAKVCAEEKSKLRAHIVASGGGFEDSNFVGLGSGAEGGLKRDCNGPGVGGRREEYGDAFAVGGEGLLKQAELEVRLVLVWVCMWVRGGTLLVSLMVKFLIVPLGRMRTSMKVRSCWRPLGVMMMLCTGIERRDLMGWM